MTGKVLEIVLRSTFAYVILIVLARIIGRKLISRITFYDFIVGITLGSIAVRIALGSEESPFLATISASVITILVVITEYFNIKTINFRKLVDGEPIILISNGKLLDYNLKKVKITVNKLLMLLREKDIFNIYDVEIAIIESDGELSILQKKNKEQSTTDKLNISANDSGLISDIIIDGKIMYNNLKSLNRDENWVKEQLKIHNISDIKEVFYAGLNAEGIFCISTKIKK